MHLTNPTIHRIQQLLPDSPVEELFLRRDEKQRRISRLYAIQGWHPRQKSPGGGKGTNGGFAAWKNWEKKAKTALTHWPPM
jgi:hypothetical protein